MDILYLLIPLSVVLLMLIIGTLAWAMNRGQFDDLEHQGEMILEPEQARARAQARRAQRPTNAPLTPAMVEHESPVPAGAAQNATLAQLDMGQHEQKHIRA